MSVIGSNILAGASGQGGDYTIARSLRFRSSASGRLSRTPASTGNRQIYTFSAWVKRGLLSGSASYNLFSSPQGANDWLVFGFREDTIYYDVSWTTSANRIIAESVNRFRDPSAWYHVVLSVDTTQATNTNRIRIYVNNQQVTSYTYDVGSGYIAQNANTSINTTNNHGIGFRIDDNDLYYDGYIGEVNFIDGQALTPSSFGATNASTGVWQPKRYAGTYGTNGFYLPFTDNSALTTSSNVGLGKDFSGNGNYWTTNNISITAGATYDSMTDVPTLTSATASNFATLNPLGDTNASQTVTDGNLTHTSSTNWLLAYSTIAMQSGKFYAELTVTDASNINIGIISTSGSSIVNANTANSGYAGKYSDGYGWVNNFGTTYKITNNVDTSYGTAPSNGDVIMIAFDATNGSLYFGRNGTWFNSSNPATSTSPAFSSIPMTVDYYFASGMENANGSWNFGQRPFAYTPPTGFVALNTFNLPTPTIGATASTQANKYFDTVTYAGNGSTQTIGGFNFSPDFVWVKERSSTSGHVLFDTVRGVQKYLETNASAAEGTDSSTLTAFNSNGFSVGSSGAMNQSSQTYVGWCWDANGTGVTNTSGSITSTVSANTSAGFSVVTYTGNAATSATIGHGLGVAPKMLIVKNRQTAVTSSNDWNVYFASLGTGYLILNSTNAYNSGTNRWNGTNPTSTVFSVGGDSAHCNNEAINYVAYCFSEVAGYSKFGSYTGNGSTDGPFVFTGFRPRWIMVKRSSSTSDWFIIDTARNTYNEALTSLFANASNADYTLTTGGFDIVSNGFKLRVGSGFNPNASGETYIYMAFAENPFKYSLAR
jgi:hypothetical protein